jgi:hypothetical protein
MDVGKIKEFSMATIIFNGKTYNTPEEMSPTERATFEQLTDLFVDKNGNGIPDFLEGDIVKNVSTAYANIVSINGNMVSDMNELPEDVRAKVQTAFEKMSELGMVETPSASMMPHAGHVGSDHVAPQSSQFTATPSITSQEYTPTIQEGNRPGVLQWILLGVFMFFCLMIAVAGGVYFFLR